MASFTSLDGLAGGHLTDLRTYRHGQRWVVTHNGLTRLNPQPEPKPDAPPPVFYTRVQVATKEVSLPERRHARSPRSDSARRTTTSRSSASG